MLPTSELSSESNSMTHVEIPRVGKLGDGPNRSAPLGADFDPRAVVAHVVGAVVVGLPVIIGQRMLAVHGAVDVLVGQRAAVENLDVAHHRVAHSSSVMTPNSLRLHLPRGDVLFLDDNPLPAGVYGLSRIEGHLSGPISIAPAVHAANCSTAKAAGSWSLTLAGTAVLPSVGPTLVAASGQIVADQEGKLSGDRSAKRWRPVCRRNSDRRVDCEARLHGHPIPDAVGKAGDSSME
jgi:hypothetical protein